MEHDRRSGVRTEECEVLVVGGGPAGLFLAGLLAQQGVDVVVLERRDEPSAHSRAIGLHPPALAALQSLGVSRAAVDQGVPVRRGAGRGRDRGRHLGELSFDRVRSEFPFVLTLPQNRTEGLLAHRLEGLAPGALQRGWEVLDVHDRGGAVRTTARRRATGGSAAGAGGVVTWGSQAVVGADGAHSLVRARARVGTHLKTYPDTYLMGDFADVTGDGDTAAIHLDRGGVVESFPLPGAARRWVAHTGCSLAQPCPDDLAAIVARRTGEQLDPGSSTMISSFTVRRQLAGRMVAGRLALIGDAAHEISPIGGQGMTLGWLDALALAPLLEDLVADGAGRPLQTLSRFQDFERARLHSARTAARRAEFNMVLGRPISSPAAAARDAVLGAVLATPLRHPLARAFSMDWARAEQGQPS